MIGCSTPGSATDDAGADASDGGATCFVCGGSTPAEMDASLAFRVRARLAMCNGQEGCHVSGAAQLTYPPGDELRELVGVPSTERPELLRVKPGDPSASYVYMKLRGDGGIEGGRMPLNAESYDPRIPAVFFAWIEAGAPSE